MELKKPLVYGSIFNFDAQLAVFNYKGGKNLRDIYPEPPDPEDVPGCNENGMLGVVPGITLTNGVPIETVSKMLGHTSLKTTQIYARIVDSKISADMKKLKLKLN